MNFRSHHRKCIALFVLAMCFMGVNLSVPVYAQDSTRQAAGMRPRNPYMEAIEKDIAGKENEPAETVFKNIQILKGMPAGRVLRIMGGGFSAALGVKCLHCHVENEWDKDDQGAKKIARKMWMMQQNLSKEIQGIVGEDDAGVNCYTCHRGSTKPAMRPERGGEERRGDQPRR